jgi:hypothetical protein
VYCASLFTCCCYTCCHWAGGVCGAQQHKLLVTNLFSSINFARRCRAGWGDTRSCRSKSITHCILFNRASGDPAQWVVSALLACAALHEAGRVTLLFCLLACIQCCYFVLPPSLPRSLTTHSLRRSLTHLLTHPLAHQCTRSLLFPACLQRFTHEITLPHDRLVLVPANPFIVPPHHPP